MKQDSKGLYSTDRDRVAHAVNIATRYWLETIQTYLPNRILVGVELYVAKHGHNRLREACTAAIEWNKGESQCHPILLPDFASPQFREPKASYGDDLNPESLALISALLSLRNDLPKNETNLSDVDLVRKSHGLVIAAEHYIASLPKKPGSEGEADLDLAFSYVTLDEIHESNKRNSGRLPLLPALQIKQKDIDKNAITAAQTQEAIKREIASFLKKRVPNVTDVDWNRQAAQDRVLFPNRKPISFEDWQKSWQQSLDELKKNKIVSVQHICKLRWHRFRMSAQAHYQSGVNRTKKRDRRR
jgi:hypothetical protein